MYYGCQPYRELGQLSLEEYERVSEEYRLYKRCAHCPLRFRQAENIGQFQCRLHPGVLRFDFYRHGDYYSCCGGASDSVGCREADHIARDAELCEDDEALRHEQLCEHAFEIVPCGLFGFGLMPPRRSAVLWESAGASGDVRRSCFAVSFNAKLTEEFVHRSIAHQVSEQVQESPILLRTLSAAAEHGSDGVVGVRRSVALQRIENGWRTRLDDDDSMMETEEAERERRRATTRPDYDLPYLIVSRIG